MVPPAERSLGGVLSADAAPVFNTAVVARRTGLLPATFRAWERRYGFPMPLRGLSNQRSYSERDVRALAWLQDRLAEGMTISAAVALLRAHLERPTSASARSLESGRSTVALAADLERALLAFDARAAETVLGEAFSLYPVEMVCQEVLASTLVSVGDGWHEGRVEPAQEHFASAFARRRLSELLNYAAQSARGPRVLAGCAPGEWHELGLLTVAVFLARRGWSVIYLGASVPIDGLDDTIARLRPAAVVLSATTPEGAAALTDAARHVAELPRPRPVFGYGGQPFEAEPALRDAVPGLYLGPDAAGAVQVLERAVLGSRESG